MAISESLLHRIIDINSAESLIADLAIIELYLYDLVKHSFGDIVINDANASNNKTIASLVQFGRKIQNDYNLRCMYDRLVLDYDELQPNEIALRLSIIEKRLIRLYREYGVQTIQDIDGRTNLLNKNARY